MASIYIKNISEIKRVWRLAPKRMERELKNALKNSLLRLEASAVKFAPADTGNLRGKITTSIHNLHGSVHTSDGGRQVKYLKYIHEGTGIYGKNKTRVVPKKSKVLRFKINGKWIYAKSTKGTKANPFFDKAAKDQEDKINSEFEQAVENVLQSL